MHASRMIIGKSILLFCFVIMSKPAIGMTLSGPITADTVTVSGSVTVSSMTVSTMTVTHLFNVTGTTIGIPGRVLQTKFSSSTVTTTVTSSTFTAVPDMVGSIALSNANNYVRISLTGNVFARGADYDPTYITIYRDSTNLGDTSSGLSAAIELIGYTSFSVSNPVGVRITDWPGDTNTHTYQVYIRNASSGQEAIFPYESTGYLLLEEVSR